MIEIIKTNYFSFKKTRMYINFITTVFVVLTSLIFILSINCYCDEKIDQYINTESNREIILILNENISNFIKFINNQSKVENVFYEIYIHDYNIDNNRYIVQSYIEGDNLKENIVYTNNLISNIYIYDFNITNIVYDKNIEFNLICLNQDTIKEIIKNDKFDSSVVIKVLVKRYNDLETLINNLKEIGFEANRNEDSIEISIYMKMKENIKIIFIFSFLVIMIAMIFILINFYDEQKNNICIYQNIGLSNKKIFNVYFSTLLINTIKQYIFCVLVMLPFSMILTILLKHNFIKILIKNAIYSISVFVIIELILTYLLVFLINYIRRK